MDLTLGEAAKAANRSKQALAAAIQKGRLSATKDANGVWHVDSSELLRVYPDAKHELGDGGRGLAGLATNDDVELAALRARVTALEELRRAEQVRAEELRVERDAWKLQAERLLLALPAGLAQHHSQQPQVVPAVEAPVVATADPGASGSASSGSLSDVSGAGQGSGRPEDEGAKKRGWLARLFGVGGGDDGQ